MMKKQHFLYLTVGLQIYSKIKKELFDYTEELSEDEGLIDQVQTLQSWWRGFMMAMWLLLNWFVNSNALSTTVCWVSIWTELGHLEQESKLAESLLACLDIWNFISIDRFLTIFLTASVAEVSFSNSYSKHWCGSDLNTFTKSKIDTKLNHSDIK